MKRAVCFLTVMTLLAVSAPAVRAGEAARLCKFDEFVRHLKIGGKQKALMERVLGDFDSRLVTWDAANKDRRRKIEAKIAEAKKARDMATICEALNEQRAMQTERDEIVETCKGRLLAMLKPDQQAKWEAHALFVEMHGRFKRFKLDSGQVADIRSRCGRAGKEMADLRAKGNSSEAIKAKQMLERQIVQDVLTPSQRELFAGPSGQYDSPREGETEAERKERIRLAVMGWTGERLQHETAKSLKSAKSAMAAAIIDAERRWREGINPRENRDGNWRNELLSLINTERRNRGLKNLSSNGTLNGRAQRRADNLAPNRGGKKKKKNNNKNRKHHRDTGGPENVARGPSNARSVFNNWIKNGSSRNKILSRSYHKIGLGRRGNIWVAKFGR